MSFTKHDHNDPKILHFYMSILTKKVEKKLENNKNNAITVWKEGMMPGMYLWIYLKDIFIIAYHLLTLVTTYGTTD